MQKHRHDYEAKSGIQKDFHEIRDNLKKANRDNATAIILAVGALGISMASLIRWLTAVL